MLWWLLKFKRIEWSDPTLYQMIPLITQLTLLFTNDFNAGSTMRKIYYPIATHANNNLKLYSESSLFPHQFNISRQFKKTRDQVLLSTRKETGNSGHVFVLWHAKRYFNTKAYSSLFALNSILTTIVNWYACVYCNYVWMDQVGPVILKRDECPMHNDLSECEGSWHVRVILRWRFQSKCWLWWKFIDVGSNVWSNFKMCS